MRTLRNRSLNPGCYSNFLEHWLQYFDKDQLIVLDGDELKLNPAAIMSQLQLKLNLEPLVDYNQQLQYVPKKGFFCPLVNESSTNLIINTTNQSTSKQINLIDVLNGSYMGFTKLSNKMNHTSLFNNLDASNSTTASTVQVRCLGKSKGRIYPEIDSRSISFLHKYYMKCNTMLFKLLVRLKVKIPSWLIEELND